MAISLVGSTLLTNNASTASPALPAGVQENDYLLMSIGLKRGTRTISGIADWTLISQFLDSTGTSSDGFLYAKLAGASEAAPDITFSATGNNTINLSAWRGVDTTTPQDVDFAVASVGFATSVTAPSLTTVTDGAVFVTHLVYDDGVDGPATTTATGLTALYESSTNSVGGAGHYKTQVTAGATDSVPYTINGSESMAAISFALRPLGQDYTARKGATGVEITHTLTADGITSQTLNGETVTLASQSGQVATLSLDESAITTSGEYDLVLGDGVGTETFTVQYNVIGLPSNTLLKDGAALASLTDVEMDILDAAGATVLDTLTGITTDASGVTGQTVIAAGAVDDAVRISGYSDSAGIGFAFKATLELL